MFIACTGYALEFISGRLPSIMEQYQDLKLNPSKICHMLRLTRHLEVIMSTPDIEIVH
jgi:hypothetical protein